MHHMRRGTYTTHYKEEPTFFHEVNKMLGNMYGLIILGGDFNQTLDDHLDWSKTKTGRNSRDRTAINTLKEEIGLVDIWRLTNPYSALTPTEFIHE